MRYYRSEQSAQLMELEVEILIERWRELWRERRREGSQEGSEQQKIWMRNSKTGAERKGDKR